MDYLTELGFSPEGYGWVVGMSRAVAAAREHGVEVVLFEARQGGPDDRYWYAEEDAFGRLVSAIIADEPMEEARPGIPAALVGLETLRAIAWIRVPGTPR